MAGMIGGLEMGFNRRIHVRSRAATLARLCSAFADSGGLPGCATRAWCNQRVSAEWWWVSQYITGVGGVLQKE